MSVLSVSSFLSGARDTSGKEILRNPFFNPLVDRAGAESQVIHYRLPVIRNSSNTGLYAITYICYRRRSLVHTLFRQNADYSVDVMTQSGDVAEHYNDIYELLDIVLERYGVPASPRTPASPSPRTRALRTATPLGGEHDPV